MTKLSKKTIFYLKVSTSLLLLTIILFSANWNEVWTSLHQVSVPLIIVVFFILVALVLLSAWKWWWLLRVHRAPFPFASLNRWYFIAVFFNNFFPTSIGGDGFRVYRTYNNDRSPSTSIVAVFVERISGILTLLGLGWLAASVDYLMTKDPLSATIMYFGLLGLGVFTLISIVAYFTKLYTRVLNWQRLPKKLKQVLEHMDDYTSNVPGTLGVLALSVLFHTINIIGLWLLIKALGGDISFVDLTIVVSMVNVVSILPLSINGVGLVDGAYIYLLGQYGVDHAQGVSFSILLRFLMLPVSAVGMILYLRDKRNSGQSAATTLAQ